MTVAPPVVSFVPSLVLNCTVSLVVPLVGIVAGLAVTVEVVAVAVCPTTEKPVMNITRNKVMGSIILLVEPTILNVHK